MTIKPVLPMIALILGACATTAPPPPEAMVVYKPTECASSVNLAETIAMDGHEKTEKRAIRNRTATISHLITAKSPCLEMNGVRQPYALFKIPRLLDDPIVYAGGRLEARRTIMPLIATYDADGELVRQFNSGEFRRYTGMFGHSFAPTDDEVFVMVAVDPASVGDSIATVETSTEARNVTMVSPGGYASSGIDTVGIQRNFDRAYSFEGFADIRVVYPKPKD